MSGQVLVYCLDCQQQDLHVAMHVFCLCCTCQLCYVLACRQGALQTMQLWDGQSKGTDNFVWYAAVYVACWNHACARTTAHPLYDHSPGGPHGGTAMVLCLALLDALCHCIAIRLTTQGQVGMQFMLTSYMVPMQKVGGGLCGCGGVLGSRHGVGASGACGAHITYCV